MSDSDEVLRDVGRRIAEIRRKRKLTQLKLAELLDVSDKYLQRIEAGRQNLSIRSLVTLADALDVGVKELFYAPRTRQRHGGRPRTRKPPQRRRG